MYNIDIQTNREKKVQSMRNRKDTMRRATLLCAILLLGMVVQGLNALAEAADGGLSPAQLAEQVQKMAERLEALEAERALDIRLNRSDLEKLPVEEGPIYVTGHKAPDSDTVCSAILYAKLLNALGYDARPCVLGPLNNETKYILNLAGVEEPELLTDVSGLNIVLVDHSEYSQSADGLDDAHIICIIDHHGDGSVTTGGQLIYDARPLGSTATIICIRYRNYGVEVDAQAATLMVGAILSDTNGFKSESTTTADREVVRWLSAVAGIGDVDALYKELYKQSISYGDMTDQEIYESDVKDYECGGVRFTIGCVNVYDEEEALDMAARMAAIMPEMQAVHGADMAFAQVSIFHDDISVNYLVASNDAAAETLKEAFGDKLVYDGTSYILKPGVSRRKVLAPALIEVLENHPKE